MKVQEKNLRFIYITGIQWQKQLIFIVVKFTGVAL